MSIATILSAELGLFVVLTVVLVAWQILAGRINTRGLLATKSAAQPSPARQQLLVVTLGCAAWYLGLVLGRAGKGLPDVPHELLLLLGGSHVGFLGAKAWDQLGGALTSMRSPSTE